MHDHYSSKFENQFAIILVTDNVTHPANVSIFRIADAFGIEKLIIGRKFELNRKVWNTSRAH